MNRFLLSRIPNRSYTLTGTIVSVERNGFFPVKIWYKTDVTSAEAHFT